MNPLLYFYGLLLFTSMELTNNLSINSFWIITDWELLFYIKMNCNWNSNEKKIGLNLSCTVSDQSKICLMRVLTEVVQLSSIALIAQAQLIS